MGRMEFWAWCAQTNKMMNPESQPHTWRGTENDEWWQAAKEKQRRLRGR